MLCEDSNVARESSYADLSSLDHYDIHIIEIQNF